MEIGRKADRQTGKEVRQMAGRKVGRLVRR